MSDKAEPPRYCRKCEHTEHEHEPQAGELCWTCGHWCRFIPMNELSNAARHARGEVSPPKPPEGY